jgi:hypothetical protein
LHEVTCRVNLREFLLENFAGDLQYHPRRALLYLLLGVASACYWAFSPEDGKLNVIPLVFILGSLTLLVKGIFLFRPSSEGVGLSQQEVEEARAAGSRKGFPPIATQAAQIVQDFGTGGFLLWPLLALAKDIDQSWDNPPRFAVFVSGGALFVVGWLVRRLTSSSTAQNA